MRCSRCWYNHIQEESKFNLIINKSTGWIYRSRESHKIQKWWQCVYVRFYTKRNNILCEKEKKNEEESNRIVWSTDWGQTDGNSSIIKRCVKISFETKKITVFFFFFFHGVKFAFRHDFWMHNQQFKNREKYKWSSASSCPPSDFAMVFRFMNDNGILKYCNAHKMKAIFYN